MTDALVTPPPLPHTGAPVQKRAVSRKQNRQRSPSTPSAQHQPKRAVSNEAFNQLADALGYPDVSPAPINRGTVAPDLGIRSNQTDLRTPDNEFDEVEAAMWSASNEQIITRARREQNTADGLIIASAHSWEEDVLSNEVPITRAPDTARWVKNARRARLNTNVRRAASWLVSLAVGGFIITVIALMTLTGPGKMSPAQWLSAKAIGEVSTPAAAPAPAPARAAKPAPAAIPAIEEIPAAPALASQP